MPFSSLANQLWKSLVSILNAYLILFSLNFKLMVAFSSQIHGHDLIEIYVHLFFEANFNTMCIVFLERIYRCLKQIQI